MHQMEDDLVLKQPTDRRLGNTVELQPGPPGAEFFPTDFGDAKRSTQKLTMDKDSSSATNNGTKLSGRRTPPREQSPPHSMSRRRSSSRNARTPPSPCHRRRRSRSPTSPPQQRRNRNYYSPERRRYDRRRTPDRRRSPPRRGGGGRRDRFRMGRGRSISRSRSGSPRRGGSNTGRWSPKKKPASPPPPLPPGGNMRMPPQQQQQQQRSGPPQAYGVMPQQMYGQPYGNPVYNHQYGLAPQTAFPPPQTGAYGMQGPPPTGEFNASYAAAPGAWGVNDYGQQVWIQHANVQRTATVAAQQQIMPTTVNVPAVNPSAGTRQQQQQQQQPQQQQQQQQQQLVQSQRSTSIQRQTSQPMTSNHRNADVVTEPQVPPLVTSSTGVDQNNATQEAVAQEAENQRDELKKQRANYIKKAALLRIEYKVLEEQRDELMASGNPPTPTTQSFLEENCRLRAQIEKKVDTFENVVDMLNGIIRDDEEDDDDESDDNTNAASSDAAAASTAPVDQQKLSKDAANVKNANARRARSTSDSSADSSSSTTSSGSGSGSGSSSDSDSTSDNEEDDDESSTNRLKNRAIKSMQTKQRAKEAAVNSGKGGSVPLFNYVFYDPEQHWCPMCNIFPKSARDYLNHLHSKEHMNQETMETPWHANIDHDPFPVYTDAPTKRVPVRGMEFLVASSAWYCKLCNFWIGDLHCASAHLKSQKHSSRYEHFLKQNPDYESRWQNDRETALQTQTQINQEKQQQQQNKTKNDDNKASVKKSKKKSDDKNEKKDKKKKKKRKHSKKHSRKQSSTAATSTSSSISSDDESMLQKPKKVRENVITTTSQKPHHNQAATAAASIRVSMRKQENADTTVSASDGTTDATKDAINSSGRIGRWTVAQEAVKPTPAPVPVAKVEDDDKRRDDSMMQQWNTVQPVISESEKKLLEQLKGKLKGKRDVNDTHHATSTSKLSGEKSSKQRSTRRSRSPTATFGNNSRRSPHSRSRSRGRMDYRNDYRRGGGGGRRSRSRSRGHRRRSPPRHRHSRSRDNRRRRTRTRSRSRTRSGSRSATNRVEKPILKHSEFRPRTVVERNNKTSDSKSKKDCLKAKATSSTSSAATAAAAAASGGKKLPFIGKMPVFKKQNGGSESAASAATIGVAVAADQSKLFVNGNNEKQQQQQHSQQQSQPVQVRPIAPTAAQIQMAMMEDAYGNAPPFHPEAVMLLEYEELMPDPVQFANLMTHGPPPPPPPLVDDDVTANNSSELDGQHMEDDEKDMLPPGIDETETDLVPQPFKPSAAPLTKDGELPKDLAEALDIIFPTNKANDDIEDNDNASKQTHQNSENVTTISTGIDASGDEMDLEDLAKQGIHMVKIATTATSILDSDRGNNESNENNLHLQTPVAPVPVPVPVPVSVPLPTHVYISQETTDNIGTDICMDEDSQSNYARAASIATDINEMLIQDNEPNGNTTLVAAAAAATETTTTTVTESIQLIPNDIPMPLSPPLAAPADITIDSLTVNSKYINDVINAAAKPSQIVCDISDIPEPPASPTESEKQRRQAALEEHAMLGIDSNDLAAQYM